MPTSMARSCAGRALGAVLVAGAALLAAAVAWGARARVDRVELAAAADGWALLVRSAAQRLGGAEGEPFRWAEVYRVDAGAARLDAARTALVTALAARAGGLGAAGLSLHGRLLVVEGAGGSALVDLDRGAVVHRAPPGTQVQLLPGAVLLATAEDASWRRWTVRLADLDGGGEIARVPGARAWSVRGGRVAIRDGAGLRLLEPGPWRTAAILPPADDAPLGAGHGFVLAAADEGRRLVLHRREGEAWAARTVAAGPLALGGVRRERLLAVDDGGALLADGREVGPFGAQDAELLPGERLYALDAASATVTAIDPARLFEAPPGCAVQGVRVEAAAPARAAALLACAGGVRRLAVLPALHRAALRADPAAGYAVRLPPGDYGLRDLAVVRWARGDVAVLLARRGGAVVWTERGGARRLEPRDPRPLRARLGAALAALRTAWEAGRRQAR